MLPGIEEETLFDGRVTLREFLALRISALLDIAAFETGYVFELDDAVEPEELHALLEEIDRKRGG